MLAGAAPENTGKSRRLSDHTQKEVEQHKDRLNAYVDFCSEIGEKPADVALAWMLNNPVVTSPIIGPRTIEQLVGSLRSLEIQLNKEQLLSLEEIWPGPGGEAPEAYAW
jgi:aryl-alcohol dehydrogenase-like predicted oxidoreductase